MYIGPYEIDKETEIDDKYIEVSYKDVEQDGEAVSISSEIFAKEILDVVKTKKSEDFNYVRDARCGPIVKQILEILLEKNVVVGEVNYICQKVLMSMGQNEQRAIDKLLGKESDKVTFYEIHKVLLE